MKTLLRLFVLLSCLTPFSAGAVNPDEMLDDPALEGRAREISKGLRCLVCQNENIDDSNAELAGDLRLLVRERLSAGDSNDEVVAYIVSRYGDFVLLKPPFKPATLALWLAPPLFAVFALIGLVRFYRRSETPQTDLSEDEKRRLAALLDREDS